MVIDEKMTIETTNSVTSPSPSRCNTVLRTGFTPPLSSAAPNARHSRRASTAQLRFSPRLMRCKKRAAASPVARILSGRSGEPPALGNLHAIALPVRADVTVSELLRVGLDVVVEDDHDLAAVVVDELLHLGVDGRPLLLIGLAASCEKEIVELGIGPFRLIPRRTLGIDHREQPVAGGPAAPIVRAPRLLQPNVVEITIVRLAHDVDVDPGGLGALLVEHRRIDGAVEGGIGDRQVDV